MNFFWSYHKFPNTFLSEYSQYSDLRFVGLVWYYRQEFLPDTITLDKADIEDTDDLSLIYLQYLAIKKYTDAFIIKYYITTHIRRLIVSLILNAAANIQSSYKTEETSTVSQLNHHGYPMFDSVSVHPLRRKNCAYKTYGQTDRQMDGHMDRHTYGQTDRQMDGHMDRHTYGQTDKQTDGWTG